MHMVVSCSSRISIWFHLLAKSGSHHSNSICSMLVKKEQKSEILVFSTETPTCFISRWSNSSLWIKPRSCLVQVAQQKPFGLWIMKSRMICTLLQNSSIMAIIPKSTKIYIKLNFKINSDWIPSKNQLPIKHGQPTCLMNKLKRWNFKLLLNTTVVKNTQVRWDIS